uniref:trypsin n=1 Tax=Corethrella appendiculata TaxID=1370023 RepID=U5EGR6_9DIPT
MNRIILTTIFAIALSGATLGRPQFYKDNRIVGGFPVDIKEAPYQVSLQFSSHFCGGSVISSRFILTAGHCVFESANEFSVRVGATDRQNDGELFEIQNVIRHPKYNGQTIDYDFAIIELETEIQFDETKQPIELPEQDEEVVDGTLCKVSGWGDTKNGMESDIVLRAAMVPSVNQDKCNHAYDDEITDRMICAGYTEGGKDACQGDSGGPLVAENKLIGVVSWGKGCAEPNYFGVYSRVASVVDWIKEHTDL